MSESNNSGLFYIASWGCDYSQSWCTTVYGPASFEDCVAEIARLKLRLSECAGSYLNLVCTYWQHWLKRVSAYVEETGYVDRVFDGVVQDDWKAHLSWLNVQFEAIKEEPEWSYKLTILEDCLQTEMYGGRSTVDLLSRFDWSSDSEVQLGDTDFISYLESLDITSFKGMVLSDLGRLRAQVSNPLCKYVDITSEVDAAILDGEDSFTLAKSLVLPSWWTWTRGFRPPEESGSKFEDLKMFLLNSDSYAIHPAAEIDNFEPTCIF